MIEPTVEAMLTEYFHDWQGIESLVRGLVLQDMGAFKEAFLIDFEDKEKDLDKFLDLAVYSEFMKRYPRFPHRIQYLKGRNIIGAYQHELLDSLNKKRNKIHKYQHDLPESVRLVIAKAHSDLQYVQILKADKGLDGDYKAKLRQQIETSSKELLSYLSKIV